MVAFGGSANLTQSGKALSMGPLELPMKGSGLHRSGDQWMIANSKRLSVSNSTTISAGFPLR